MRAATTVLRPTMMDRPMVCSVLKVGYARMDGDSRTKVPKPDDSSHVKKDIPNRSCLNRILLPRAASAQEGYELPSVAEAPRSSKMLSTATRTTLPTTVMTMNENPLMFSLRRR
jgi:hypothetical protein